MVTSLIQRVCPDFTPGGAFTVGAEEELFLLGPSGDLDPGSGGQVLDVVRRAMAGTAGTVSGELFAAQIEFATGICADAGAIATELGAFRAALSRVGARALAAGLHPTATFGDAVLNRQPRYQAIGERFAGLLRTPTAAFQVHVGLPDEPAALLAYRGMRHRLAIVQALASSSPYWHGRDSGMASGRWAVISSYPRGGPPPILHTWEEYAALVEQVAGAAEVAEHTQIWWDARLQPRLGTLEVRVMDAQYSCAAAAGLAALVQGLVRHAVENPVGVDIPSAVLSENSFRVARYGLETTVVGADGLARSVRELAVEAVRDARNVLAPDGLDTPLTEVERTLVDLPEPERQRRLHARSGIEGVLADLVARTDAGR